ncbi:hypothetical protein METSCH_A05240 [Metschnikowia aff. pulcherrima]|uniref:Uncharacterized protein n=1 Tax=Metschnikowia aff. pulcherrima TaxID=2163413 RepID=A0A4V1ADJ1_9ASCO|nr:hypothetical protein METSCH_A05240 [Metschnikowia aff. pulcherrima]
MERMLTGIQVVDCNVDDVILAQHNRVHVAVDVQVCGKLAQAQRRGQDRHLGRGVGDVVEESIVHAVAQVVHGHVERHQQVRVGQELLAALGNQEEIVQVLVDRVHHVLFRRWCTGVVRDVVGQVQEQVARNHIQHRVVKLAHERVVAAGVALGCHQHVVTLSHRDVKHIGGVGLDVDTVHRHNGEVVVLHVEVLRHETADIHNSHEVGRVGLNHPGVVSRVVEQKILWDWLGTSRVVKVHEFGNQVVRVLVVPLAQG